MRYSSRRKLAASLRLCRDRLLHGADIAAGAEGARALAPDRHRPDGVVRRPFPQHLEHADAHAVGQRIQRLGPVQGHKAQSAPFFDLYMGLGLMHGARLSGHWAVARHGVAQDWQQWISARQPSRHHDCLSATACAACAATTGRAGWWRRTRCRAADFIWPLFVIDGENKREPVASMPGVDRLVGRSGRGRRRRKPPSSGIPVIALFPYTDPALKTEDGREAVNADNLVCRAVRAIKKAVPEIGVLCDVALDPYTSHGHDGLIRDGDVHNDDTIEVLVRQALVQAEAGCDIIAPSDMMDGRVGAIRAALEKNGHHNTLIMAYAAKYASAFYGPFRDAVGSAQVKSAASRPATSAPIRWTRPMATRPCAKWRSTSPKAPTW